VWRWSATYCWKALDECYTFASDLTLIRRLQTKLWDSKIVRVPILGISGLPLGNLGTKWHLDVGPMAKHKVYYKGEDGAFPPSPGHGESCKFMFACDSYVHLKCSNYALTNLLFGLCRFMWVIELLVNLPSPHPRAPTHPSTLEVMWTREHAPTPSPSVVFTFGLVVSPSISLGVCQILSYIN
jgi:hypothetical protein